MELRYKHKFWSLVGSAVVYDENDNELYRVKGKFFTLTRKKKIYDANKKIVYKVRNRMFQRLAIFRRAFITDAKGKKIARISRKITIHDNYIVDGFEQAIRIEGTVLGREYSIFVDDKEIAKIGMYQMGKGFTISIEDPEDAPFVVALFVAINNIKEQKASEASSGH